MVLVGDGDRRKCWLVTSGPVRRRTQEILLENALENERDERINNPLPRPEGYTPVAGLRPSVPPFISSS
jgi:hypothetical protein